MIFIIGTKYRFTGLEKTNEMMRCDNCGAMTQFIKKTGRNYITLFFVLPLFPIGRAQNVLECPNCKTRYQTDNF